MDAELKTKWVAALRSGHYKQGAGRLRDGENNCCCLGVLCDIADPAGWKQCAGETVWRHRGSTAIIDRDLHEQLALTHTGELMGMNDGGQPFAQIAKYIEKNL